jgi:hypothetical protein
LRRRRWTVVLLVAIGGDQQRILRQHAEVNCQRTHVSRFTECAELLQT